MAKFYKDEFSGDKNLPRYDENILRKSKKEQIFQQVKVSPDNKYIAYVTNDWGRKRIWLYDQATGKQKYYFQKQIQNLNRKQIILTRLWPGIPTAGFLLS